MGDCESCLEGYALSWVNGDYVCVDINTLNSCIEINISNSLCTECDDGYTLGNDGICCYSMMCNSCVNDSKSGCIDCSNGGGNIDGRCC